MRRRKKEEEEGRGEEEEERGGRGEVFIHSRFPITLLRMPRQGEKDPPPATTPHPASLSV